MNNGNIGAKKEALKQNKIATSIIMLIALIIGLIYMQLLFILLDSGGLRPNYIIKFDFKSTQQFINYNIFLTVIYTIVTIIYLIKSIKYKEYIYSVISASTFIFTLKWIYTMVGTINPLANIKLVSISITYVGFIIFIVGIICELILTLKRNKELEYEKMRNQEQIRNDFFANISHKLRTPVNIFYYREKEFL